MKSLDIIFLLLKAVMIIGCTIYVIVNLISWATTKDNKKLKKAAVAFGGTFLFIITLSVIEFYFIY